MSRIEVKQIETGLDDKSAGRSRIFEWIAAVLLLALAVWLVSPMFTSVHVEAYTASISSMATAAHDGNLAGDDPTYPVRIGFFYLLRVGVGLLLQFLQAISGSAGDWQFRVLMIGSLLTILSASCVLARRWAKVAVPASAAALMLTPGLIESSFAFNDKLISAAFVTVGLSLIAPERRWWLYVISGGFIGFGILCRLDAILLLPVAAGLIWLSALRLSDTILPGISLTLGALSIIVIGYWAAAHATFFDALAMGNYFQVVVADMKSLALAARLKVMIYLPLLFFGLPMVLLIPLGIVRNYRSNGFKWNIVLVAYPIMFLLVAMLKAPTITHFYLLLAPFIAIHGGRAIEILATTLRQGSKPGRRAVALLVTAGWLAILILPPVISDVTYGPTTKSGRLWNPLLWFRWQQTVSSNFNRLEQIVAVASQNQRTLVVSSHFNDDRYLHLRLLENGFSLSPDRNPLPGCGDGFELYRHNGHELIHIRTMNSFGIVKAPGDYLDALQINAALRCQALFASDRFYLTGFGHDENEALFNAVLDKPDQNSLPEYDYYDRVIGLQSLIPIRPPSKRPRYGLIRVTEFDQNHLQRLAAKAESVVNDYRSGVHGPGSLPDYQAFRDHFANTRWSPPNR